jgi:hypothetical protein
MAATFSKLAPMVRPYLPTYGSYQQLNEQQPFNASVQAPIHQCPTAYQSPTLFSEKYTTHQTTAVQPSSPGSPRLRKKLSRTRRTIKIVILVSAAASAVLSLVMTGAMGYMLWKFYKTKDDHAQGDFPKDVTPWAKDTKTWPTYMLLLGAGLTFMSSLGSLVNVCCRSRHKIAFKVIFEGIHIGVWVTIAIVYRFSKTGNDMWGWSCDMINGERQEIFADVLNFDRLCQLQVCLSVPVPFWTTTDIQSIKSGSWGTSMAEAGVRLLLSAIGWLLSRKAGRLQEKLFEGLNDLAGSAI